MLDDYHLVNSAAVQDLLNELIRHWPRSMHLVLVTRNDPKIPLASLRAKDKLNEIRSRDLRFTESETSEYFDLTLDRQLSPPTKAMLQQRTEGWITGLRLSTLSLSRLSDAETSLAIPEGVDANIASYLVDEVLSLQLPAVYDFLIKTSILDNFNPDLCETVVGENDPAWSPRACLDWLVRDELFITSLDKQREWYRYHQLFRDLLRQRLKASKKPEDIVELHRRAATWFASQGLIDDGLRHALEANDIGLAAYVIAQGLRDVLNRGDRRTLERWARFLPEEGAQTQPWLLMVSVYALSFAYQLGPLGNKLLAVEALLDR